MSKLLLVDGHSVIYRSFFAFIRNPLRNSKGFNTSAVFGFAQMLRRLLDRLKPDLVAVVFDAPGRTFRHEKYEQYKLQRPPAPEELPPQIPIIKEMVRAWGLATFEKPGAEADDVIGTFAVRFADKGFEVTIATADKDMLQLVGGRITAYDPWREKRFRSEDVKEKLGVPPAQVPDFLGLSGDTTDNIPGVPGVGPVRALDILAKCGTVERAIELDKRVAPHAALARLSKELATIDTAVELEVNEQDLVPGTGNVERLREVFREMDFRDMLAGAEPEPARTVEVSAFRGIDGLRHLGRLALEFVPGTGLWVCDGEETMLVPETDRGSIRALVEDKALLKIGHGLKDQAKALRSTGADVSMPLFDVEIGAWLLDPNRKRFNLEDVVAQVLGRNIQPPAAQARPAEILAVYQGMAPQVQALGLEPVAEQLDMPLVPVLARMEERGIKVDVHLFEKLEQELGAEQAQIERQVHDLAGGGFNISSPKQLGEVLFGKLKLARGRRTKTGFSTSAEVLEELAKEHEIARLVLKFRELSKLCGTYLRPLRETADPKTARVHCRFNQAGTSTGRLSASEPNLQNVPIRTEVGRRIRSGFVADGGSVLMSADYSQIELRVLAHLAQDEALIEAFRSGEDIHVHTAAAILGIDRDKVTEEHRRIAKMVNYGLIYGMGGYGLSWRTDIPVEQAQAFLDEYMLRFAGVARWREQLVEHARETGVVRTISGRIRPVPGIVESNRVQAEAARRAAINAPVQGSAADVMKQAMLRLEEKMAGGEFGTGMVLQVHDELVFEVRKDRTDQARELVQEEMRNAWKLDVPLEVSIGVGPNWGEAH